MVPDSSKPINGDALKVICGVSVPDISLPSFTGVPVPKSTSTASVGDTSQGGQAFGFMDYLEE